MFILNELHYLLPQSCLPLGLGYIFCIVGFVRSAERNMLRAGAWGGGGGQHTVRISINLNLPTSEGSKFNLLQHHS